MMMDYSVYLVTDRKLARERKTFDIIQAAIHGGVSCVQLREKTCSTREFVEEAQAIRDLLARHNIPLIINDRIDVALAVKADGVHLGQKDLSCRMARELLPDTMIIGISAGSLNDAIAAQSDGADYIGVSPIYATPTKTDTEPPLGLKGLREIRAVIDIPLVGIGGLNTDNVYKVIQNGADGVAVVSAIVSADDPTLATRRLHEIVRQAKIK